MPIENEVKLRVPDAASAERRIAALGYSVEHERVHEMNVVCDTSDGALRRRHCLLRVRTAGEKKKVTFKGAPREAAHKSREETEFTVSDAEAALYVFEQLGLTPVFRYEKFRTEFAIEGEPGVITLDETPIGCFLELEGPAEWLDETARKLGFSPADYIKESYGGLYLEYVQAKGTTPGDMLFSK